MKKSLLVVLLSVFAVTLLAAELTITNSPQQVLTSTGARRGLVVMNVSSNATITVHVGNTNNATMQLVAGGSWTESGAGTPQLDVYVTATSNTSVFATEW